MDDELVRLEPRKKCLRYIAVAIPELYLTETMLMQLILAAAALARRLCISHWLKLHYSSVDIIYMLQAVVT